jgi:hypothetical protein
MNTDDHQISTPCGFYLHTPYFLGDRLSLLPRRLLRRPRKHLNRFQLIQPTTNRLLVVLPAHARRMIDKVALPERVGVARRLREDAARRDGPLLLRCRLGWLGCGKVPREWVGACLEGL